MGKNDYQSILAKIDQRNTEKMIDFLREVPYLKNISKNQLVKLVLLLLKQEHNFGYVVCRQGDPSNYVFIVKNGEY